MLASVLAGPNVTVARAESKNAYCPIDVTESGSAIEVRAVPDSRKALSPMLASVLAGPNVTVAREEPRNAYCPSDVTESGTARAVMPVAPLKASVPMLDKTVVAVKSIVTKSSHPLNAFAAMVVVPDGTVTSPLPSGTRGPDVCVGHAANATPVRQDSTQILTAAEVGTCCRAKRVLRPRRAGDLSRKEKRRRNAG